MEKRVVPEEVLIFSTYARAAIKYICPICKKQGKEVLAHFSEKYCPECNNEFIWDTKIRCA